MSYILDALRKADAQRERDPARGIHAQPMRVAIGERRVHDGYRAGFWAATAAALVAVAAVAWYLYQDSGGQPVPAPARTELVGVAAPAPASVAPPAVAPAAAVLPPPVVVAQPPVVPAPATTPAEPAPRARATARQSPRNSAGTAALATRTGQAPAPAAAATSAPAAAAASATATAPPMAGLPAEAPKLAISGGVYSANAAQRMLIVNGQVFNEGVEVAPGLLLEEIRSKAAVIRFRGSRYSVPY
jgi:general secretion pathway protein B